MNARLSVPNHTDVIRPVPFDIELERNALGLALLGDSQVPAWLETRHFYTGQHQLIFKAARESRGSLTGAAALLRERALLAAFGAPRMVSSAQLVTLTEEALQAVQMGWAIDFERLRELANQRALLATMERVAIRVRGGDLGHAAAIGELREHVRSCK